MWLAGAWLVDPASDGPPARGALRIEGDAIAEVARQAPRDARDLAGLWLVPAVVDAHVHLAFAGPLRDVVRAEAHAGVAAVLDLGMPERLLGEDLSPLQVVHAGPLLTAPGGYPTQSWGRDGYGAEIATPEAAAATVRRLHARGARFAKLAFDARYPVLTPEVARAAVAQAHALGMRAAAHALSADAVRRALDAGCDVLAHAPREPVEIPADVTVISTLRAFDAPFPRTGRIVYGTDLGNEGTAPGIDAGELARLARRLSPREVLRAATCDAAALLGLARLGHLRAGAKGSLLALRRDPLEDPTALAEPALVLLDGIELRPAAAGSA